MSPAQADRVRAGMRRLLTERFAENSTALAAALRGISPSAVSQILSGKNSPSLQTAEAVARELGISVGALLGVGVGDSGADDPIPERAAAAHMARAQGRRQAAIDAVVASAGSGAPRRTAEQWYSLIVAEDLKLAEGIEMGEPERRGDLSTPRRSRKRS